MKNKSFEFKSYPIVFIGSGISKRYLENYPTWEELLKEYWLKIEKEMDFYHYLLTIKDKYKGEVTDQTDLNHKIYTEAATQIEFEFNELFTKNKIEVDGLDAKRVFTEGISPFKFSICQRFSESNIGSGVDQEELQSFKNLLKKAKMIVTTNYDSFIENLLLSQGVTPKKYIGNQGFFEDTVGWSELYCIHGDVTDPLSIVISKEDYEKYDNKSILISAKILSNMIKNPILFLGYSLTDRNVRQLLSDFSSQLPKEDGRKSAERIILIQRTPNEQQIIKKHISDQQLKITYTSVETDNFKEIYDEICSVNEGLSPYDVLRYQRAIKTLIVNEGEKGTLDTLLVSPSDLDNLEDSVKQGKNLVVALGDKKYIFTQIKEINYLEDYLFNKNEISNKLAIEFIVGLNTSLRIPLSKLIKSSNFKELGLDQDVISKLDKRIEKHGRLDTLIASMIIDKENSLKTFITIKDIKSCFFSKQKELFVIIKNIKNIPTEELDAYVKNEAFPQFRDCQKNNLKTDFRKLFLAYDLLTNGDINRIK